MSLVGYHLGFTGKSLDLQILKIHCSVVEISFYEAFRHKINGG